ncbi:magnesium transporter CorA family protein [Xinfangfangia sp. CPCC 101601]|uniref:Magnesium transporter CorA family protein n=1 Tax=Pseudogemmobacter lacusdianii TaxID=3069608 RepID=A0ABU0VZU5_9RHOB|nr:magnesium transporter CorA family protein [Xinfangfangia sp. CPCC 101601]MDQ2067282.1 magnesium transporter CorA family protein [Xinfangfangia sp. CPCC 101601]
MITIYREAGGRLVAEKLAADAPSAALEPLADVVWIDLVSPIPSEEQLIEAALEILVPSREDMEEIEYSSGAYTAHGAQYLTVHVLEQAEGHPAYLGPVTCIVTRARLVTVRYHEPPALAAFAERALGHELGCLDGITTMMALMETIVDRLADLLEDQSRRLEATTRAIFAAHRPSGRMEVLSSLMQRIGKAEDLNGKLNESLQTLARVTGFMGLVGPSFEHGAERARLKTLTRDVRSLLDASTRQERKIDFQLNATLGVINIRQADVIKIFSVVAFVFLPPTLIASIYGMNFAFMPELEWRWGYPAALGAMVLSALLPYLLFRWKKWL